MGGNPWMAAKSPVRPFQGRTFFLLFTTGFTHGYSRLAPSGPGIQEQCRDAPLDNGPGQVRDFVCSSRGKLLIKTARFQPDQIKMSTLNESLGHTLQVPLTDIALG
jgi:hypothetical protein